jgi:hypothetical protein
MIIIEKLFNTTTVGFKAILKKKGNMFITMEQFLMAISHDSQDSVEEVKTGKQKQKKKQTNEMIQTGKGTYKNKILNCTKHNYISTY